MKMKKILATLAASAVSVSALAAMSLTSNAAETEIAYTQSEGSLSTDNDGVSLRRNIYNTWGNSVTDINNEGTWEDNITIEFTISGIGDASALEDGTEFIGWVAGQAGNTQFWKEGDAGYNPVKITGDGTYTASAPLTEASATVDCLILQTNINLYAFGEGLENTTANITINKITTGEKEETPADDTTTTTTTAPAAAAGTTTTTTAAAAGGTTTTTKAAAAAAGTTTAAAQAAAATGDAGVGVVVAAVAVAGAAAYVSRKKND